MKKEYLKPSATLVENLEAYCDVSLFDVSGYGKDHSIYDDLLEE